MGTRRRSARAAPSQAKKNLLDLKEHFIKKHIFGDDDDSNQSGDYICIACSKRFHTPKTLKRHTKNSHAPSHATPKDRVVSKADFETFAPDAVMSYLVTRGVSLDAESQAIFRNKNLDGESLVLLGQDDFLRKDDLGFARPVAELIFRNIPKE